MYSKFKVKKGTGTYSDTIEAFGLANLLNEIQIRTDLNRPKLWIEDKGLYYELTSRPEIQLEQIQKLSYFPLFRYVVRDASETFNENYFDYPKQDALKKERRSQMQKAYQEYTGKEKAEQLRRRLTEINRIYSEEKFIDPHLDVYSQVATNNNFEVFKKLYNNFYLNKSSFQILISYILDYYSDDQSIQSLKDFQFFNEKVTALQIYNPNAGKGQNRPKASGSGAKGIDSSWISETMKISGALTNMLCQLVKVGSSYDMKVVVPDFKKAEYNLQRMIVLSFKKNIKENTPLKVDILNLLILNKQLIENTEEYKGFKARNIITGLHSTYQKDLGQNKAVVNISELQTPNFIEFDTEDEAKDWVEFLDEQVNIIGSIKEFGDATQGLIAYRTFLTSSHFQSWAKFIFWYAEHIMSNFSRNKNPLPFKVTSLNKFFKNMNMNEFKISEIISNEGFQKVATAIRNSTVILQGAKSRGEKIDFEIRYGVAQELKNKSKTSTDLAGFVGEFIGTYNAETARKAEINKAYRKPVRDNELTSFYTLLDLHPSKSKVIGAMLASYGFALEKGSEISPNEEIKTIVE